MFSRFDRTPACDRRTDRHLARACYAEYRAVNYLCNLYDLSLNQLFYCHFEDKLNLGNLQFFTQYVMYVTYYVSIPIYNVAP